MSHIVLDGRIHTHLGHPVAKVKLVDIDFTAFASEVHVGVATKQLYLHRVFGHVVDDSPAFEQHLVVNSQHSVELLELSVHVFAVDAAEDSTILSALERQFHVIGVAATLCEVNIFACQLD